MCTHSIAEKVQASRPVLFDSRDRADQHPEHANYAGLLQAEAYKNRHSAVGRKSSLIAEPSTLEFLRDEWAAAPWRGPPEPANL
jgi:hypothetical protein